MSTPSEDSPKETKPKTKPKPRASTVTVSLKVEEADYTIHVTHQGMQLASVSPVQIKPGDYELYRGLLDFAIQEWARAKQIEKVANTPAIPTEPPPANP